MDLGDSVGLCKISLVGGGACLIKNHPTSIGGIRDFVYLIKRQHKETGLYDELP